MSRYPDLVPDRDAVSDLGSARRRWGTVYADSLSDGAVTLAVADLVTNARLQQGLALPSAAGQDGKWLKSDGRAWQLAGPPPGVLPAVTSAQDGSYLAVSGGAWRVVKAALLPAVSAPRDNGRLLRVVAGVWTVQDAPPRLPPVTAADKGRLLQVLPDGSSVGVGWHAADPPSDVLPLIGEGDHGSVLTVQHGGWAKRPLGLADRDAPGLMPALPGTSGRVLAGDGGWAALPAGMSGQWRIGDLRETLRDRLNPDPGWLAADGTAIPFEPRYQALYRALGGSDDEWAAQLERRLPDRPDALIRYLPDSQAPAEFGLVLDVEGSSDPTARLHFELELYREPVPLAPVGQYDTLEAPFKANCLINFSNRLGAPYASAAPGWFWWEPNGDYWRLYSRDGERARPDERAQVLIDFAETGAAARQHERLTPGSYYYRYRQVVAKSGVQTPGAWRWGRFLTAGGFSGESFELSRICDLYAGDGRERRWAPPALAARMFVLAAGGLIPEGGDFQVHDDGWVALTDQYPRGRRLTLLGQGHLSRPLLPAAPADPAAAFPRHSRATPINRPPEEALSCEALPVGRDKCPGWTGALPFNSATKRAGRPDQVLLMSAAGLDQNALYTIATRSVRHGSARAPVPADAGRSFGIGFVDEASAAAGDYDYVLPPGQDGTARLLRLDSLPAWFTLAAGEMSGWGATPYFRHSVAARAGGKLKTYFIPGEAPGVYSATDRKLIPLPAGSIFRGSRACCLAADGRIYCLPRFAQGDGVSGVSTGILRFDPESEAIDYVAMPSRSDIDLGVLADDASGWHRLLPLRDGRLLAVPYFRSEFLIIDIEHGSVLRGLFGSTLLTGGKWRSAWTLPDGSVCGFGTTASSYRRCFRFNPDRDEVRIFNFWVEVDAAFSAAAAVPGGVLLGAGTAKGADKLYLVTAAWPDRDPRQGSGHDSPLISAPSLVGTG